MTPITDELAQVLAQLVTDLNGYKNCPTIAGMAEKANAVLAKYTAAKAAQEQHELDGSAQTWARIQEHYPGLWQEWLSAGLTTFHVWLQAKYPDVWSEYVKCDNK